MSDNLLDIREFPNNYNSIINKSVKIYNKKYASLKYVLMTRDQALILRYRGDNKVGLDIIEEKFLGLEVLFKDKVMP